MKKINIIFWIVIGIFSAFMIFTAIPDALNQPEAIDFISAKLLYPQYFV